VLYIPLGTSFLLLVNKSFTLGLFPAEILLHAKLNVSRVAVIFFNIIFRLEKDSTLHILNKLPSM
jgi:hypothetical protein